MIRRSRLSEQLLTDSPENVVDGGGGGEKRGGGDVGAPLEREIEVTVIFREVSVISEKVGEPG